MTTRASRNAAGQRSIDTRRPVAVRKTAVLRAKNQMTLPASIVRLLGLRPGDRLMLEAIKDHPEGILVRRIRDSYAGALEGIFGTPEEPEAQVDNERESWED